MVNKADISKGTVQLTGTLCVYGIIATRQGPREHQVIIEEVVQHGLSSFPYQETRSSSCSQQYLYSVQVSLMMIHCLLMMACYREDKLLVDMFVLELLVVVIKSLTIASRHGDTSGECE